MDGDGNHRGPHILWIHKGLRILTFQKIKGFTQISFPTHEAMIRCALRLTESGFRIR